MQTKAPLTSIEGVLKDLPEALLASSRGRDWPGIVIDRDKAVDEIELRLSARDHHIVFVPLQTSTRLMQIRDGKKREGVVSAGSTLIMPAGHDSYWQGFQPAVVRLRIPQTLVGKAVETLSGGKDRSFEIRNIFHAHDDDIHHLSAVLCDELSKPSHPVQPLMVEALSSALVFHLIRAYDVFANEIADAPQGLNPLALKRVLDYIEDSLETPLTLDALADLSGVSRFHFVKLFRQSMGFTPMAYVERSRLQQAQILIRTTALSIAQIAYSTGFSDQSYFVRRFRKYAGCTPSAYRRG
jgi:AraC family transcriptional regulator